MQIQRSTLSLPATTVLQLSPNRPLRAVAQTRGQETLLAAVRYPPRASQVQPLADLLPDVLASYGLHNSPASPAVDCFDAVA